MAFIRPSTNSTFHCHCLDGLKLIARLRLGLSQLRFHKFKHNFQDALNTICSCGTVEPTIHYFLYCPNFLNERLTLFNKFQSIDENILIEDDSKISKVLLFGDDPFNDVKHTSVLTASTEYILSTFWCSFISKLTLIYLSICSLFLVFYHEIALIFMLFNFVFSILTITYFRWFC